jgi:hypothetical protein
MPESIGRQTDDSNLFVAVLHISYISDTNPENPINMGFRRIQTNATGRFITLMNRPVSLNVSVPILAFGRQLIIQNESA